MLSPYECHPDWNRISYAGSYYPIVYCPDHPRAWKSGYVFAHRIVAELVEGRFLHDNEVVHHINENKADFRPFNLAIKKDHADHKKEHLVAPKMSSSICLMCGKEFTYRSRKPRKFCLNPCRYAPMPPLTIQHGRHGTSTMYNYHGCRCDQCKAFKREEMRKRRNKF